MRSSQQLKVNLEKIKDHNKRELEKLNAEYYDRINRGLDLTDIKRRIEQAERVAENSERLAKRALDQAEEREKRQSDAMEQTLQKVSEERIARKKKAALSDFLASGGTSGEFE